MSYKQMTGNIISATKVEPVGTSEVGAASGVWNLDDVYDYNRGANWPEAGVANPDTLIENNFSTFLYTGNGSTQTITNNINLSEKGGLVIIKRRDGSANNWGWYDTERGPDSHIKSNGNNAANTQPDVEVKDFNSNGFELGTDWNAYINTNGGSFCSWTFKKAPKFFDIVTYTGNATARTISHNLGSVPGMIIIKRLDALQNWEVYHKDLAIETGDFPYILQLNTTSGNVGNQTYFKSGITSTEFKINTYNAVNADGGTYVAYVFAHETGADSTIQCGSYAGNGNTTGPVINLGWEPQWILVKKYDDSDNWHIFDSMRGISTGSNDIVLYPNTTAVEASTTYASLTATGFSIDTSAGALNQNNQNFIYMAIRRPNMATITDATEVFDIYNNSSDTTEPVFRTSPAFPVDYAWFRDAPGGADTIKQAARLTGPVYLNSTSTAAEASLATAKFDYMNGWRSTGGSGQYSWMWKRAKGYFDVVAYEGTGANRTVAHGLSVVPEMMWIKSRDDSESWVVYHANMAGTPESNYLYLNEASALNPNSNVVKYFNNTAPTSSVFTVGIEDRVNTNNDSYVAFLFATLAGVSKLGTVTHSGSSTDVDCGFSAGARFVLLRRTDAGSGWYIWDSVRGIIAGNDPYLLINTTAAQVTNTDFIDPLASGFQISGDFTDGDYVFYAIA